MKSHKNIVIYYIVYVTIKDSKNIKNNIVKPLYVIIDKVNGYFEEINGKKYLTLLHANESQEKIKRHEELWSKIRYLVRLITKNSDHYDGKYLKIKFNWDHKLPPNKTIELLELAVRAVFHENNKRYFQVFLDECLYKLWVI